MILFFLNFFTVFICQMFWILTIPKIMTPRFHSKLIPILTASVLSVANHIFSYSKLLETLLPQFDIRQNIKSIVLLSITFIYIFVFFKATAKKRIVVYFVAQILIVVFEAIGSAIISFFVDFSSSDIWNSGINERIKVTVIIMPVYFLMSLTLYEVCSKSKFNLSGAVFGNIVAILTVNCAMIAFIMTSNAYRKGTVLSVIFLISPLLVMGLSLIFYRLIRQLNEQSLLKEKLYWIESIKAIELDHYNKLHRKSERLRKIRHDFKDQMASINFLINENTEESLQKAGEIIDSLYNSVNESEIKMYTQNSLVNTIVSEKADEACEKGIPVQISINLPEKVSLDDIDLNCIFLKLFNIAIYECQNALPNIKPYIKLNSEIKETFMTIEFEFASINEDFTQGLSLLNEITLKYNGALKANVKSNVVFLRLLLKLPTSV